MHLQLDPVWSELRRVLAPGGLACLNLGDATRTIDEEFQLFLNHVRVSSRFPDLGFVALPDILWRKQTNSPTKFMGSGMLPPNAYVTLEHEYILIFRKPGKRSFLSDAKMRRKESAYFWEERNEWFSHVWDKIKGEDQKLTMSETPGRIRSAAFPLMLAYRLISMFSVAGDCVLDPFLGTGTTTLAAIRQGRNSIGYEIDSGFELEDRFSGTQRISYEINVKRLKRHGEFVRSSNREFKHFNSFYNFPVMTSQEVDICLWEARSIKKTGGDYEVDHEKT